MASLIIMSQKLFILHQNVRHRRFFLYLINMTGKRSVSTVQTTQLFTATGLEYLPGKALIKPSHNRQSLIGHQSSEDWIEKAITKCVFSWKGMCVGKTVKDLLTLISMYSRTAVFYVLVGDCHYWNWLTKTHLYFKCCPQVTATIRPMWSF